MRGAAAAVIGVLGLGLPLLTLGLKETIMQHEDFYARALRGGSALTTLTAEKPAKALYNNNALPVVLRRLLSPVDGGKSDTGGPLLVNFADLPPGTIVGVYAALMLVFVGASVTVTLDHRVRWPPEDVRQIGRVRAEFGVWCCLMLLTSPLVWTHYLPLAFWPLTVLTDDVERTWHETKRVARG